MSGGAIRVDARVMRLNPASVLVPERVGFLHMDKATALGRLIAVDGQRDPIKVVAIDPAKNDGKSWRLVVGMHRLHGCLIEGIEVLAIEVSGKPEDLIDLEASENLHRRPLGSIERAKFTAALVRAAQKRIAREHGDMGQHERAAKARWDRAKHGEETVESALKADADDASDTMSRAYGWQDSVADALGLDKRTIYRDLTLSKLLIEPFPDLIEALSKHPVVGENGTELKKIAAVKDEGLRRTVIEALLADPEIGAEDARIQAGLEGLKPSATPVAHQKHWNAITSNWSRLGNPERTRFLPKFAAMLTPGQKRDLRDLLNEELGE